MCTVKTPDDEQRNFPKHVEFYSKNKFEKLVHLVGFIMRMYYDARSPELQIKSVNLNNNYVTLRGTFHPCCNIAEVLQLLYACLSGERGSEVGYLQSFNKPVFNSSCRTHIKPPTNKLGINSILQDRVHSDQRRRDVCAQTTITK